MPAMRRSHRPARTTAALLALALTGCRGDAERERQPLPAAAIPTPAPAPPPPEPPRPATVDDLLALVDADAGVDFLLIRDPRPLLDLFELLLAYYDGPLRDLAASASEDPTARDGALADTHRALVALRARYDLVRARLADVGLDLGRGVVVTGVAPGSPGSALILGARDADALPRLVDALGIGDAARVRCRPLEGAPAHVACASDDAVLAAYRPAGDPASRRRELARELPGVDLDGLHAIAVHTGDRPVHLGAGLDRGALALHISLPAADGLVAELREILTPARPALLRHLQPGTGFVWLHLDADRLRRRLPELADLPSMIRAPIDGLDGELLIAGLREPAAMQLRLGTRDAAGLQSLVDLGLLFAGQVPTQVPGVRGSKIGLGRETLKNGTRALHLGVTGLPDLSAIAGKLGLVLDLWLFAADGSLALVLGADQAGVEALAAAPATDQAARAALPRPFAQSLASGETALALHLPLDPLQGPLLRQLLDAAQAAAPELRPDLARHALALLAPLSSASLWVTDGEGGPALHAAVQLLGDLTTPEGRAAFDALAGVAAGGDAPALFGALADRFAASDRKPAYQARAGTGSVGDLVGSAATAAAAAVVAFLPFSSAPEKRR